MGEKKPGHNKARSLTVTALLGLFIVAVLAAFASKAVPGGINGLVSRARRGGDGQDEA